MINDSSSSDDENVVFLATPDITDRDPKLVLKAALKEKLASVVVIGFDQDGIIYLDSSEANSAETNWLIDHGKKHLLQDTSSDD